MLYSVQIIHIKFLFMSIVDQYRLSHTLRISKLFGSRHFGWKTAQKIVRTLFDVRAFLCDFLCEVFKFKFLFGNTLEQCQNCLRNVGIYHCRSVHDEGLKVATQHLSCARACLHVLPKSTNRWRFSGASGGKGTNV